MTHESRKLARILILRDGLVTMTARALTAEQQGKPQAPFSRADLMAGTYRAPDNKKVAEAITGEARSKTWQKEAIKRLVRYKMLTTVGGGSTTMYLLNDVDMARAVLADHDDGGLRLTWFLYTSKAQDGHPDNFNETAQEEDAEDANATSIVEDEVDDLGGSTDGMMATVTLNVLRDVQSGIHALLSRALADDEDPATDIRPLSKRLRALEEKQHALHTIIEAQQTKLNQLLGRLEAATRLQDVIPPLAESLAATNARIDVDRSTTDELLSELKKLRNERREVALRRHAEAITRLASLMDTTARLTKNAEILQDEVLNAHADEG